MCSRSERFRKKRLFGEMLPVEVGIENHGEIANEDSAKPGGTNFVFRKEQKAVFARSFEPLQLRCEIGIEVDAEFRVDLFFGNDRVAKDAADDRAANVIIGGKTIAAHGGQAAVVNRVLPVR